MLPWLGVAESEDGLGLRSSSSEAGSISLDSPRR